MHRPPMYGQPYQQPIPQSMQNQPYQQPFQQPMYNQMYQQPPFNPSDIYSRLEYIKNVINDPRINPISKNELLNEANYWNSILQANNFSQVNVLQNNKPIISGTNFQNNPLTSTRPNENMNNMYSGNDVSLQNNNRYSNRRVGRISSVDDNRQIITNINNNTNTDKLEPLPGYEIKPICGDNKIVRKVIINGMYKYEIAKGDNMELENLVVNEDNIIIDTDKLLVNDVDDSYIVRHKLLHAIIDSKPEYNRIFVYATDVIEKKEIGFCDIDKPYQITDYISPDIFSSDVLLSFGNLIEALSEIDSKIISVDVFLQNITKRFNNYLAIIGTKGKMESDIISDYDDFIKYLDSIKDTNIELYETYVYGVKRFLDDIKCDIYNVDASYDSIITGKYTKGVIMPYKYTGVMLYGVIAKVLSNIIFNIEKDERALLLTSISYPTLYNIIDTIYNKTEYASKEIKIFFNVHTSNVSIYKNQNNNYVIVKNK